MLPSSFSSSDSGASPATVTPCGLCGAKCFICEPLNCNYVSTLSSIGYSFKSIILSSYQLHRISICNFAFCCDTANQVPKAGI